MPSSLRTALCAPSAAMAYFASTSCRSPDARSSTVARTLASSCWRPTSVVPNRTVADGEAWRWAGRIGSWWDWGAHDVCGAGRRPLLEPEAAHELHATGAYDQCPRETRASFALLDDQHIDRVPCQ